MKFKSLIFTIVIFLFLPRTVFATDVVINEYFPNPDDSETIEWIEVYNSTENEIDISGWKLDDIENGGSQIYSIAQNTKIPAKSFYVFERGVTGIILNNDTDGIRLLNSSDQVIDEHEYDEAEESVYYGRVVDGEGHWVGFSDGTKGSTNLSGTLIPTSTSTPQPTQQATNTPSPTKTPTPPPTKFPTSTVIPSKTPTSVRKPTLTNVKKSPTPKNSTPTIEPEKKVLADTSDKKPNITKEPPKRVEVKGSSIVNPGTILITLGGFFLLACGILLFYMKKKAHNAP